MGPQWRSSTILGHPGMDVPPPNEDFGRQPPQDDVAEQAVLGGMLLSKDAIADVVERLRPGDFYRPATRTSTTSILDLYGRGEPADAVTVAAELDRRGLLRRIGGAPYLHTLISTVPTAANAGYYASIVAEKALLRRLVEAGTRVVQYGYAGAEGSDVAEVVDRAQAEIYDVTDRRLSEDFVPLEQSSAADDGRDRCDRVQRRAGQRGADGLRRTRRSHQRSAPGPDDHRRGQARRREGAVTRHATADADGLDDDGRCYRRRLAARRRRRRRRESSPRPRCMLGRPCYEVEFSDGTTHRRGCAASVADRLRHAHYAALRSGSDSIAAAWIARTLRGSPGGAPLMAPVRQVEGVAADPTSVPVRCVEVDNSAHLYLAGPGWCRRTIPLSALDFLRSCSIKHRLASVMFSLEMSKSEIVMRLLSAEAKIKLADMRSGRMSDDDWTRLARRMSEISEAPLYIDDSPNLTMMEIRAKARRLTAEGRSAS